MKRRQSWQKKAELQISWKNILMLLMIRSDVNIGIDVANDKKKKMMFLILMLLIRR